MYWFYTIIMIAVVIIADKNGFPKMERRDIQVYALFILLFFIFNVLDLYTLHMEYTNPVDWVNNLPFIKDFYSIFENRGDK